MIVQITIFFPGSFDEVRMLLDNDTSWLIPLRHCQFLVLLLSLLLLQF